MVVVTQEMEEQGAEPHGVNGVCADGIGQFVEDGREAEAERNEDDRVTEVVQMRSTGQSENFEYVKVYGQRKDSDVSDQVDRLQEVLLERHVTVVEEDDGAELEGHLAGVGQAVGESEAVHIFIAFDGGQEAVVGGVVVGQTRRFVEIAPPPR